MAKRILALLLFILSADLYAQVTITNVFLSASTSTTATIQWTTSGPSTSQVLYGFDSSIPFATPVTPAMVTSHTVTLTVLDPSRFYYFAVVSIDGGGHVTQSATSNFGLCGGSSQPFNPATGTINNYYEYGTFTLTWVPPSGSSATPTVCGQPMPTTVSGTLSGGASMSASVADSYKVIPGPGTWHVAATDAGNLSPIAFNFPLSAQNTDVSAQMQAAAGTAGLTDVLANLVNHTVFPPWICTTFNGLCAAAGGGVTSVLPGTNVTCSPFASGKCVGDVTVNSTGATNPAGLGVAQYANNVGTAFFSGGVINSDTVNTSNNGITQAQSTLCTPTNCIITRPPSSTDTENAQPLVPVGSKLSSLVIDQLGNAISYLSMNPTAQTNSGFGFQAGNQLTTWNVTEFSEPNPGPIQGQTQGQTFNIVENFAPGYSLGEGGSLFPPQSQYTGGASLWASPRGTINFYNFNGSGIQNAGGSIVNCWATGDCGGVSSDFVTYSGGYLVFSDEGGKGRDVHLLSNPDWQGTVASISDSYHLKANQTARATGQGQGRLLVQTTGAILTQTDMTSIIAPDSSNPPYITYAVNLPVSNFRGHTTADCVIPIQMGTTATITNCDITIDSGALVANNVPASSAANISNRWNHSMQVLCAIPNGGSPVTGCTAPAAPGHVTASFQANRSIVAGSYIFQGGLAGDVVNMGADDNTLAGGESRGSVFPIIGSDLHRAYVVDYNASQVWMAPPDGGSQASTTATSGIAFGGYDLINVQRVSGIVTMTLTTGITANQQFQLNGARFITISGCTDASFNNFYSATAYLNVNNLAQLIVPQAGPDSVGNCPTAHVNLQGTKSDIYIAAEALDVENHTTATIDGSFAHSFQPGFTTGATLFQPQSYSSAFLGNKILLSTGVPSKQTFGEQIILQGYAAMSSNAIDIAAQPIGVLQSGYGGKASTGSAVHIAGGNGAVPFSNVIFTDFASAGGNLFAVGAADPSCGLVNPSVCPLFEQYNTWNLGGQHVQHYDAFNNIYSFCIGSCATQLWNIGNGNLGEMSVANGEIIFNSPTLQANAQFEALSTGGGPFGQYLPITQFHNPNSLNHITGAVAYDNVTAAPITVAVTVPAGSTQYLYMFVIHTPFGDSFTPFNVLFSLSSTFSGGTITLSCSNIGAGNTADLYKFVNPNLFQVTNGTGHCSSNSGNVIDDGSSYGSAQATDTWSAGAPLYTGSVIAQGLKGLLGFSTSDIFGNSIPGNTITASINQCATGVLCANTTTTGDHLAELLLGAIGSGTASNTDLVGELVFSGVTTATYTFTRTYTSHPECWSKPQATTATSGADFITYTGVTSFTINFPNAFTGTVSYGCTARN